MPTGRKPKPAALRLFEGKRGHRPIRNEPKPACGIPTPPAWLSAEALQEWQRVAPELHRIGVLTHVDGAALEAYCVHYARWAEAERQLARNGAVITVRDGNGAVKFVQASPFVGISQKAAATMRAFATELGLTPSARMRLDSTVSNEPDAFEQWQRGGKAPA
jgi:P27 family predicted phage terminase small subunit